MSRDSCCNIAITPTIMNRVAVAAISMCLMFPDITQVRAQAKPAESAPYLGFDRNGSPGDENLKLFRQTFSYSGFWLNHPPGEKTNAWAGKRRTIESAGFGFLVLFNGRLFAELRTVANAGKLGKSDTLAAAIAVKARDLPSFPAFATVLSSANNLPLKRTRNPNPADSIVRLCRPTCLSSRREDGQARNPNRKTSAGEARFWSPG